MLVICNQYSQGISILTLDFFNASQHCAYHSRAVGHSTEDCIYLKHRIQDLIDQKVITLQAPTPNINSNPLPNHGGPTVNMIEMEGEWASGKIITEVNSEKPKRAKEVGNIERIVAALSVNEKASFIVMTAPR